MKLTIFYETLKDHQASLEILDAEIQEALEMYVLDHSQTRGAKELNSSLVEKVKLILKESYVFNYKSLTYHNYFRELPQQLKNRLLFEIVMDQKDYFFWLFNDVSSNKTYTVPNELIGRLLACIEVQIYESGHLIQKPGNRFKDFFMIKSGAVRTFDKSFNYMADLRPGSFFGEFNILFDLYNDIYFQAAEMTLQNDFEENVRRRNNLTIMFLIDRVSLLENFSSDLDAFKHLFKISLMKFR